MSKVPMTVEGAKKLDTRYMLKIGFEFEGDETDWFQ